MIQKKFDKKALVTLSLVVIGLLVGVALSNFGQSTETVAFYSYKIMETKTQTWKYPKEHGITVNEAQELPFYYKVYFTKGLAVREETYYQNNLIAYYTFFYENDRLIKEESYDNLILTQQRNFNYDSKGRLIKIEGLDKSKNLSGDQIYFDAESGQLTKIERYRDSKLRFIQIFKQGQLYETKYFEKDQVMITRYNEKGKVLYEKENKDGDDPNISVSQQSDILFNIKNEDIAKFQIKNKSKEILCIKENDDWKLNILNQSYPTDESTMNSFIKNLTTLKSFKVFEGDNLLDKKYGFTESNQSITIWDKKGKTINLLIGNKFYKEKAYYVALAEEKNKVYLVLNFKVDYLLNKDETDFRAKLFIKLYLDEKKLNSITLDEITFVRQANNWELKQKKNSDTKQVTALVNTILNIRAISFLDQATEVKVFDSLKPVHQIVFQLEQKKHQISIFQINKKAYAKTDFSETVYQIPFYLINYLEQKKKDFLAQIK